MTEYDLVNLIIADYEKAKELNMPEEYHTHSVRLVALFIDFRTKELKFSKMNRWNHLYAKIRRYFKDMTIDKKYRNIGIKAVKLAGEDSHKRKSFTLWGIEENEKEKR